MARRRFFVDRVREGQAEITGENAHHLARVLRVEVGQSFEITDNEKVWLATIETVRKDLVRFNVIEDLEAGLSLPEVNLYLSLIKFERFEWAVEKATELNVTRIVPVDSDRSERGLFAGGQKRVERWRRIAREASEQSRRLRTPVVSDPVRLSDALKNCTAKRRIWLDEQPGATPLISAFEREPEDDIAVIIGPEGGWSPAERESFQTAGWVGASLGPSVLRAETAVCAALSVLIQLFLTEREPVADTIKA
jgi:16S rRNA (uracil1498-N3)-methyltransferase